MEYISNISFPGLGIGEFSVSNIAFSIPGTTLAVRWYALFITIGMICCVIYAITQAKKVGITVDDVIDFALFTIPIGVLGARLYYVVFDPNHSYNNIIEVLDITKGGLAIYGGIIAGALTVLVVSYFKKINFFAFGDCVAPGVLMAQGIGRWGNFMNGEAYGAPYDGFLRMGLFNQNTRFDTELIKAGLDTTEMVYVHPTFLYESIWNLCGVLLIYLFSRFIGKKYDGQLILLTFGWYGLGRMFIEGLRTDSLYIGDTNIRVSQALAALIFIVCLALLIFFIIKKPTKPLYKKAVVADSEKANNELSESPLLKKVKELFASNKKVEDKVEAPQEEAEESENEE